LKYKSFLFYLFDKQLSTSKQTLYTGHHYGCGFIAAFAALKILLTAIDRNQRAKKNSAGARMVFLAIILRLA